MDRPFFSHTIQQLEDLVLANRGSRATLGRVWDELSYRDTDRAVQLKKEVTALLSGVVPMSAPDYPPDDPTHQLPLLGDS